MITQFDKIDRNSEISDSSVVFIYRTLQSNDFLFKFNFLLNDYNFSIISFKDRRVEFEKQFNLFSSSHLGSLLDDNVLDKYYSVDALDITAITDKLIDIGWEDGVDSSPYSDASAIIVPLIDGAYMDNTEEYMDFLSVAQKYSDEHSKPVIVSMYNLPEDILESYADVVFDFDLVTNSDGSSFYLSFRKNRTGKLPDEKTHKITINNFISIDTSRNI